MQQNKYANIAKSEYTQYSERVVKGIMRKVQRYLPRDIALIVGNYAIMDEYEHFGEVIQMISISGESKLDELIWEFNTMHDQDVYHDTGLISKMMWNIPGAIRKETVDEFNEIGPKIMLDVLCALSKCQGDYDSIVLMVYEFRCFAAKVSSQIWMPID